MSEGGAGADEAELVGPDQAVAIQSSQKRNPLPAACDLKDVDHHVARIGTGRIGAQRRPVALEPVHADRGDGEAAGRYRWSAPRPGTRERRWCLRAARWCRRDSGRDCSSCCRRGSSGSCRDRMCTRCRSRLRAIAPSSVMLVRVAGTSSGAPGPVRSLEEQAASATKTPMDQRRIGGLRRGCPEVQQNACQARSRGQRAGAVELTSSGARPDVPPRRQPVGAAEPSARSSSGRSRT